MVSTAIRSAARFVAGLAAKRLDPIRASAAMAYYGDAGVQRVLGYDR